MQTFIKRWKKQRGVFRMSADHPIRHTISAHSTKISVSFNIRTNHAIANGSAAILNAIPPLNIFTFGLINPRPSMKLIVHSRMEDIKIIKKKNMQSAKESFFVRAVVAASSSVVCQTIRHVSIATWIVRSPSSNEWSIKNRFRGLASEYKYFMILSHFDRFFSLRSVSAHNLSLRFVEFKMCGDNQTQFRYFRINRFPLYPVRRNHHVLLCLFIGTNSSSTSNVLINRPGNEICLMCDDI